MPKEYVTCLAGSRSQTDAILQKLSGVGVSKETVCVLYPLKITNPKFAPTNGRMTTTAGTSGGILVGGGLGWVVSLGGWSGAWLEMVMAIGPALSTLGGAVMGGIGGMLVGMCIPAYVVKRYTKKLRQTGVLISVEVESPDEMRLVSDVFQVEDGWDIRCEQSHNSPAYTNFSHSVQTSYS